MNFYIPGGAGTKGFLQTKAGIKKHCWEGWNAAHQKRRQPQDQTGFPRAWQQSTPRTGSPSRAGEGRGKEQRAQRDRAECEIFWATESLQQSSSGSSSRKRNESEVVGVTEPAGREAARRYTFSFSEGSSLGDRCSKPHCRSFCQPQCP